MKRFLAILLTAILLLTCAAAETDSSQKQYVQAWHLVLNGEYRQAGTAFEKLGDYEDSERLAYLLGVSAYAESMTLIGDGVLAYEFHDQWGVINLNTHTLTQPTWDSVGKLDANGLAKVRQYGQYGYINAQGETVIACEWDDISNFLYGLCTVKKNRLFGMMNAAGELVTPAEWRMLGSSQSDLYAPAFTADGRMVVQNQARKYGLMDKSGSILGEVRWDTIPDLSQELPLVMANNRYGFIDHDGNVVIEPQYRKALAFSEGLAAVSVDGMMMQFIDRENNVIVPPVYVDVQSFSGGVAHVKQPGMSWQVIDKTGQLVYFVTDQIRADYASAVEMMAAEDYVSAHNLFAEIIGYKDSYAQMNEALRLVPLKASYDEGSAYLAAEKYPQALKAFEAASGYKDADAQKTAVQEVMYQRAVELLTAEDYNSAATEFAKIGDYKDSVAQAEECKRLAPLKSRYNKAVKCLEEEKYSDAISYFEKASGYKDADAQKAAVQEIVYQKANARLAKEEYVEAAHLFALIPDYKDADEQRIRAKAQLREFCSIESIGKYGFTLNPDGFYESTNQGVANSFAMCRIDFATQTGCIYIDYYYSAEVGKDVALISELDAMLSQDSATDSEHVAAKPGARRSSGMQTVKIDVADGGDHYLTIKFKKNPKTDVGDDSFRFRIRFE